MQMKTSLAFSSPRFSLDPTLLASLLFSEIGGAKQHRLVRLGFRLLASPNISASMTTHGREGPALVQASGDGVNPLGPLCPAVLRPRHAGRV